ncbi:hypothetical protein PIB30_024816 [Stylosanthes scabra]|uniref:Uncharacterized protein n=1 Tax=Stylosanthes scabra TaxID=79078 RepID=A0ABU6X9X6_9FABA|nr:hypothetical protein [Stylosanthes scabra]
MSEHLSIFQETVNQLTNNENTLGSSGNREIKPKSETLVSESSERIQSKKPHSTDRLESRDKSRGKSKPPRKKSTFTCHHYVKPRHIRRNYKFLKREQSWERNEDKGKESDYETTAIVYNDVLITYDENYVNLVCDDST